MLPEIRSVRHLGHAHAASGEGWSLVGQDGGQSIDLGDRTLFVFSDTLLALTQDPAGGKGAHFLANCAGLSSGSGLAGALASLEYFKDPLGRPREILPATGPERVAGYRFWPEHGVLIDGKVYLFYIGIRHLDPSSTWGFQGAGSGLAVLDPLTGDCRRLKSGTSWRFWPVVGDDFHFGVQVVREEDWVYVFASRRRGTHCQALLARVHAGEIENLSAYEYLSSSSPAWSGSFAEACELASCGNEFSVAFNSYLKSYVMVYVDGFSKELLLRFAPHLWGPYSQPLCAGRLPHRDKSEVVALGFEHPRFAEGGGRTVYISYCEPHFTQNSLVALSFA